MSTVSGEAGSPVASRTRLTTSITSPTSEVPAGAAPSAKSISPFHTGERKRFQGTPGEAVPVPPAVAPAPAALPAPIPATAAAPSAAPRWRSVRLVISVMRPSSVAATDGLPELAHGSNLPNKTRYVVFSRAHTQPPDPGRPT